MCFRQFRQQIPVTGAKFPHPFYGGEGLTHPVIINIVTDLDRTGSSGNGTGKKAVIIVIDKSGAAALNGNPAGEISTHDLAGFGGVIPRTPQHIGPVEADTAAAGLEVDPATAAGAVIDHHIREHFQQGIPELVKSGNMLHLGHADPVRCIIFPPEGDRVEIEVLPVIIQPVLPDHIRHLLHRPFHCFRNTKIQKIMPGRTIDPQHPFRMLAGNRRPLHDPFHLIPEHELESGFMGGIRNGLEAFRVCPAVDPPVADRTIPVTSLKLIGGNGAVIAEPSGIHPIDLVSRLFFFERFKVLEMIFRFIAAPGTEGQRHGTYRAIRSAGGMVFQRKTAELILPVHHTQAIPMMQDHGNLPQRFPGQNTEIRLRHPGLNIQFPIPHPEIRIPRPGPADGDVQPLFLRFIQTEIRQPCSGTATFIRVQPDMIFRITGAEPNGFFDEVTLAVFAAEGTPQRHIVDRIGSGESVLCLEITGGAVHQIQRQIQRFEPADDPAGSVGTVQELRQIFNDRKIFVERHGGTQSQRAVCRNIFHHKLLIINGLFHHFNGAGCCFKWHTVIQKSIDGRSGIGGKIIAADPGIILQDNHRITPCDVSGSPAFFRRFKRHRTDHKIPATGKIRRKQLHLILRSQRPHTCQHIARHIFHRENDLPFRIAEYADQCVKFHCVPRNMNDMSAAGMVSPAIGKGAGADFHGLSGDPGTNTHPIAPTDLHGADRGDVRTLDQLLFQFRIKIFQIHNASPALVGLSVFRTTLAQQKALYNEQNSCFMNKIPVFAQWVISISSVTSCSSGSPAAKWR